MNLVDVMDALSDRLKTIAGLRVFYPGEAISPPAAVVLFPDRIDYDATYKRGMDRMSLPVSLAVGRVNDRSARKQLAAYCDGSGAKSVKAVLESGIYTAFDNVRVESVEFDYVTHEAAVLAEALFTLDIAGSGA